MSETRTTRLRRQRLKEISVEIRDLSTGDPAGTGVLVSASGLAVTCSHVVEACGVDSRTMRGGKVLVRLPATALHQAITRTAEVIWFPPEHEDDLVILEVEGGPVPPERVGICGPAGETEGAAFRSWGFRQRGQYRGLMARGIIETHVDSERRFMQQPLQLRSADLDLGMSGAAVLDIDRNLVVGFVFQVWDDPGSQKDRDLAFAVDAGLLAHTPLRDAVRDSTLPLDVLPQPLARPATSFSRSAGIRTAAPSAMLPPPKHLGEFVGRGDLLRRLEELWIDPTIKVVGISGSVGEGKTSLVREWLNRVSAGPAAPQAEPFWWSFESAKEEEDEFLSFLIGHISGMDAEALPSATAKANLAAALLPTVRRKIIVLDDLSPYQVVGSELHGNFAAGALRDFLEYVLSAEHDSMIVLTSVLPFPEFEAINGFEQIDVAPLSQSDGRQLLIANGVDGDAVTLNQIVDDWGANPLALNAVAIYLRSSHHGVARRALDLVNESQDLPFGRRLQAIGNRIQERRPLEEQSALEVLSLARRPVPIKALAEILRRLASIELEHAFPADLSALSKSNAVRESELGLMCHPVIRNLYRTRLRVAGPDYVAACHRLLADYFYSFSVGSAGKS